MASLVTNNYKHSHLTGASDWASDVHRAMWMVSTHTPLKTHDFVSEVVAGETANASLVRKTLASESLAIDDTNGGVKFDADNLSWTGVTADATETLGGLWIYKQVGGDDTTPGDDLLICFIDITDFQTTGADLNFVWSANGIMLA